MDTVHGCISSDAVHGCIILYQQLFIFFLFLLKKMEKKKMHQSYLTVHSLHGHPVLPANTFNCISPWNQTLNICTLTMKMDHILKTTNIVCVCVSVCVCVLWCGICVCVCVCVMWCGVCVCVCVCVCV